MRRRMAAKRSLGIANRAKKLSAVPEDIGVGSNVRFGSCVDGSPLARVNLTFVQIGRVQSCVRPVDAAYVAAGPRVRTQLAHHVTVAAKSTPERKMSARLS